MRKFILVAGAAIAAMPGLASAACDQATLQTLIARNFTNEQITTICGQEPAKTPGVVPPVTAGTPGGKVPMATPPVADAPGGKAAKTGAAQVPPKPPATAHPDELVGRWSATVQGYPWQLSLGADGRYRLIYGAPQGTRGMQIGTWSADGERLTMAPSNPAGPAEIHGYTIDEGTLSVRSDYYGIVEYQRAP